MDEKTQELRDGMDVLIQAQWEFEWNAQQSQTATQQAEEQNNGG